MNYEMIATAITQVCPIQGMLVPDPNNKATWMIYFSPAATEVEKAAAQAILDNSVDDPLQDAKTAKSDLVDVARLALFTSGYSHDFGSPIGVKVLQTATMEDRTNWLTSTAAYLALINAGQGSTVNAMFRALDNTSFTISYLAGYQTLLAMAAWGAALYQFAWSLKDQINAAVDLASVDAIDIVTGWPS